MKTIYQKYCSGDALSDSEVLEGREQFQKAADALIKLGPEFELARRECDKVAREFRSYASSRQLKILANNAMET